MEKKENKQKSRDSREKMFAVQTKQMFQNVLGNCEEFWEFLVLSYEGEGKMG
jgi:hypothetical protein